MRRLREEIGVEPVEYPTTRQVGASPQARAADLMAAFGDPTIRAVLASIGGDDQITVLAHLDPEVVRADPKPFFGYSDNTNLLSWLWFHGVAGYHGGSTQVHLGRGGALHPVSRDSLRAALLDGGDLVVEPVGEFGEDDVSWDRPEALTQASPRLPSPPWRWHQADRVVTAPTWGGNLEILSWTLAVSRWVHPVERYSGCILLLETSEEMPSALEVFRVLRTMGERGLLEQFPAAVVGLARATSLEAPRPPAERAAFRDDQHRAVLEAFERYNPGATVVLDVDLGHTDPQWVLPYGGRMTVDGPGRRIVAHYGP